MIYCLGCIITFLCIEHHRLKAMQSLHDKSKLTNSAIYALVNFDCAVTFVHRDFLSYPSMG
jgi:hypothetical protein